ncbi:shikimate dehydrogenase [Candidatus Sumerlaeota bacterium]|nr:shikimate dehydrogenase [Candidatus Sumerlaeota bacterium]
MTAPRVTGKTQLVGLFGWPVEHTLSPPMHNAAFADRGLDWLYVPLPTPPERLADAVRGVAAAGFRGFNVTIPHKEAVMAHLDEITPEARAIGAVNTVVVTQGRLTGHNTDVDGFVMPTTTEAHVDLGGKVAALIGAGGAARAIASGCLRMGVGRLVLTDIDAPKAEALRGDLEPLRGDARIEVLPAGSDALCEAVGTAALVANATPVGMHGPDDSPIDVAWLPEGVVVFEAIYTQPRTALMRAAEERGGKAIHGLRMLLHQGVRAFALWTGMEPDVGLMERALEEARR